MITFLFKNFKISNESHYQKSFEHQRQLMELLQSLKLIIAKNQNKSNIKQLQPQSLEDLKGSTLFYTNKLSKQINLCLISQVNAFFNPDNIPYSVKSHIKVKNMHTTRGFTFQNYQKSQTSCQIVQLLLQKGLQPICTGNVPQGLLGIQSSNNYYGSAYLKEGFSVGGSSGGDCALVATGAVPFAIISDTAGSARIPAAITGIFGFKPTGKRISRKGRIGTSGNQIQIYKQIEPSLGFASKSIKMIKQLCQLTLGKSSGKDFYVGGPWIKQAYQQAINNIEQKKIRIGYIQTIQQLQTVPSIKNAISQTLKLLRQNGFQIIQIKFDKGISKLNDIFFKMFYPNIIEVIANKCQQQKPQQYHLQAIKDKRWGNLFLKIKASILRFINRQRQAIILDRLIDYDFKSFIKMIFQKQTLKKQFQTIWFQNNIDFIITPVLPFTSIKHGTSGILVHHLYYCVLFNILDCPAASIPVRKVKINQTQYPYDRDCTEKLIKLTARQSQGHQIGIQIAGRPHHDQATLAFITWLHDIIKK